MNQNFQEAIHKQIIWKNPEMQQFAVSLVRHAMELSTTFTTDIVPDEDRRPFGPNVEAGSGIAGSVARILLSAGLIEFVGATIGDKFYPERVKSKRRDRHGAMISVYRLSSIRLAGEFLKRHGKSFITKQTELQLA